MHRVGVARYTMWVWHNFDSLVYDLLPQLRSKSKAIETAKVIFKQCEAEGEVRRDKCGKLWVRVYRGD